MCYLTKQASCLTLATKHVKIYDASTDESYFSKSVPVLVNVFEKMKQHQCFYLQVG